MKQNSNKILIVIVIGIFSLVLIAFLVILRRPEPVYLTAENPEAIAHNYLLAVQEGDFERAFGYLSPNLEFPTDIDSFLETVKDSPWEFQLDQDTSLVIESSRITSEKKATVIVRRTTFYNNGLFSDRPDSQTFNLYLENQNGQWKLTDGDMFWSYCWRDVENCPEYPRRVP